MTERLSREKIEQLDALYEQATKGELRLSKSGYSVRTGWGDEKKILGAAPRAAIEQSANAATVNEWIDNAEFWCALVNAWPAIRAFLAPVGLAEPIGLEPIRKRLKRGQYRTLPAETTGADIAFLLSLIDNYRSRLHAQEGRWIRGEVDGVFLRAAMKEMPEEYRTIGMLVTLKAVIKKYIELASPTAGGSDKGDEHGR